MLHRRVKIGLFIVLVIIFIVVLLSLALSNSTELEEFIAQSIIKENLAETKGSASLTGSIVARLSNVRIYEGPRTPLRVWKYTGNDLTKDKTEIFRIAIGEDRSKWPPYVFEFDIKRTTPLLATARILTVYDRGITPTSRGGHADTWTLVNILGNWLIVRKGSEVYWD